MSRAAQITTLPTRAVHALRHRAKRRIWRTAHAALLRSARAQPRPEALRTADRRVVIVLASAWGMGGTIRAAHNLAGYLAADHDVEILSAHRRRQTPFMGEFPPGVAVTPLDDQRRGAQTGLTGRLAEVLRKLPSVLMHPADAHGYPGFTLWSDIQLVRRLRGGAGVLIGTRPGVNIMLADLRLPGWVTIGEEQMNLGSHGRDLRKAMARAYPRLDALAVLTEVDRTAYRALLGDSAPRLERLPNTVHRIADRKSDLDSKLILAAGRATPQKGFDLLIRAWAQVAPQHPDWHLRLYCHGQSRPLLIALRDELGLTDRMTIYYGAKKLPLRMRQSAIFALSSRFEGFPLILLEAMGAGMGVVAFDCPTGPSDVVEDHGNGLLVPPRDVDAFAAALTEMIEDDDLRERCAAAAVETAHDYTMEAIGPRWVALLDELRAERFGAGAGTQRPARAPVPVA
jgi:glycosyltransferase involved in cell wall biosynthesis